MPTLLRLRSMGRFFAVDALTPEDTFRSRWKVRQIRRRRHDLLTMGDMTEQLAGALRRVEDFQSVQAQSTPEELEGAVLRLQEAVGIDEDARRVLREGLESLEMSEKAGSIFLGLIVGLFVAQEAA
jgi:hypothetical protein